MSALQAPVDAGPGLQGQVVAVKHCLNDALIFLFAIQLLRGAAVT